MENGLNFRVLRSIGEVYEEAKGSKLAEAFFEKVKPRLTELAGYFKVTENQAFLVAHIFALNYKGNTVDINDMGEYFEVNPMKMLEYHNDFKALCDKGILKKKLSKHNLKVACNNDQYVLAENITAAIVENLPMPDPDMVACSDLISLLQKLYDLLDERDDELISTKELLRETQFILDANQHFPLIIKLKQMDLDIRDKILYLFVIWKSITGRESIDLGRASDRIFDRSAEKVFFVQTLISKSNTLIKNNLIEIVEAGFFNDSEIQLTETSKTILEENGLRLSIKIASRENVISPDKIKFKELYFNRDEEKQLDFLREMLMEDRLIEIRSRLIEKNLPEGVVALLYGPPGTGKTESVYQFARESGRELKRVEISQTKSMWFGESEKLIKRIFREYGEYARQCKKTPILLFNEADAILSRRKQNLDSVVSQTENAIQNIILEELENFKGILIATTNLEKNLDPAFERRFLFKIRFNNPEIQVKIRIWQSKLPELTREECEILAAKFDFSGGQIDNIVRKYEIACILKGSLSFFDEIIDFCEKEQLVKTGRNKIGYAF